MRGFHCRPLLTPLQRIWNLAVVPGNYVIFVNNENNLNDIVLLSGHIFISF